MDADSGCDSGGRRDMKRTGGFTLIELLVVIAVMALLISLLLPTLERARESVRVVICLSNLRQIGVAIYSYAHEHDGMGPAYGPGGSDCPNPHLSSFNDWSIIFYGGKPLPGEYPDRPRKLNAYVSSVELFRCPTDGGISAYDAWLGTSYFYNSNWYGSGYWAFTSTLGGSPWVLYNEPFDNFEDHARQIMIGDAGLFYTWPYWSSYDPPGPHGGQYNWHDLPRNHPASLTISGISFYDPMVPIAFLDGHAAYTRLGPHGPGDYSVNTDTYILDPKHPL